MKKNWAEVALTIELPGTSVFSQLNEKMVGVLIRSPKTPYYRNISFIPS